MVAAAVIGASVVSAGAGALSSSNASKTQAQSAQNATNAQTQLSQQALNLVQNNNAPYRAAGSSALAQLSSMLGLNYTAPQDTSSSNFDANAYLKSNPDVEAVALDPKQNMGMTPEQFAYWHYQNYGQAEGRAFASQTPAATGTTGASGTGSATPFDISKTPGYQFQLGQGLNAVNNSGAAQSGTLNSATLTGLNNYAQGQAQSYYGNYLSQLAGIAGLGQASANNSAATGANILGNLSNNVGSNIVGAGNAQAAGQIGTANAITGGLTNAAGYYSLSNLLGGSNAGGTGSGITSSADIAAPAGFGSAG